MAEMADMTNLVGSMDQVLKKKLLEKKREKKNWKVFRVGPELLISEVQCEHWEKWKYKENH